MSEKEHIEMIESMLLVQPEEYELAKHPLSKTIYMPISFIEGKLTRIFGGRRNWWTSNFKPLQIADEVCGSIELWVKWPDGFEHCNIGNAAITIQYHKQQPGEEKIKATDIHRKKRDALVKGYPALLSMCISNAAERLGPAFGSDVKRQKEYRETYSQIEQSRTIEMLKEASESVTTFTEWNDTMRKIPGPMRTNLLVIGMDQAARARLIDNQQKQLNA